LVASSSATSIACNGGSATVTVSATGGTAPYSGTGSFTVSAGTYTYTVTDANNCTTTTTVTVTQPTQLVASSSATAIACNGGSATVTVSATGGTGSYTGTGTFTVLAGTHNYTVTDANGCTSTTTINVTQPVPNATITSQTNVSCYGLSDGSATITLANGDEEGYTGLSAGSFSFDVTIGSCTTIVNITITQPAVLVASSSAGTIACNGGTTTVMVSAVGGTAPYSGVGPKTVSAGPYSFTVTDANGCTSTTSGTITQPTQLVASSSAGTIACNGGTTTVTVSAAGGTSPYTGTGTFTVNAGPYSYTVTDANLCTSVVSGTVSQPTAVVATAVVTDPLCVGGNGTVVVSATGGTGSYGATVGSFTVAAGAAYSFTVTDGNGCTSNTISGTMFAPTAVVATATAGTISCNGGSTTVTVSAIGGTGSYTGTGSFTVTAGAYSYTVTDANGCSSTTTGTVSQPDQLTNSTTASACGSYTWSVNGQTYSTTGTYTGTTTNGSGCSVNETLNLTIIPNTTGTTTVSACDTYTWSEGNGNTYTSTPTTAPTFVSGCNTQTLALTINQSTTSSETQTACDSYTWTAGTGTTYNASGTYTSTSTNAAGCTHTKTLVLTINNSTSSVETVTSPTCGTYTWSANSTTYTSSGTYTSTSTNVAGCPDTKTLVLTINPCESVVTVKMNIQGFTLPNGMMRPVLANQGVGSSTTDVDNVTIELHNTSAPFATFATTTAMLKTNGDAVATFSSAPVGSFYIVVKHRNSLETWSANPVTIGASSTYDFTDAATKAYGSKMILVGGKYAIYNGDINQDGFIEALDYTQLFNDSDNLLEGYQTTDLNGDGFVEALDYPILFNNSDNLIETSHP
jgi:hypothetical protein